MMPTRHEDDYGEVLLRMTDLEWHNMERREMKWAFAPTHPALVTMLWFNQRIKMNLCTHLMENGEDGPTCVKCGYNAWNEL